MFFAELHNIIKKKHPCGPIFVYKNYNSYSQEALDVTGLLIPGYFSSIFTRNARYLYTHLVRRTTDLQLLVAALVPARGPKQNRSKNALRKKSPRHKGWPQDICHRNLNSNRRPCIYRNGILTVSAGYIICIHRWQD